VSRIVIVGAGIAGLALAVRLSTTHDVTVFEREPYAGGKMHSQTIDGFLFEWGPNGFLSSATDVRELITEVGLDDALIEASPEAAKRFIFWQGVLHELPSKPARLPSMSLLSPRGKLRALGELFVRSRSAPEESVFAFAARRFGREVAERIVAPALLGISGGDAAATGVAATFPRLVELEREHGSVLRGTIRSRAKPGKLSGFGAGGMQCLADGLGARLNGRLRLSAPVERVVSSASGWRVESASGVVDADHVVVTAPADVAASLAAEWDPELAALLRRIAYAPMRVVGVGFRAADLPLPLDGFGFLAARGQGVRILGALYTSTLFPDQSPPGTAYVRVFLGGATDPGAAALDADAARAIVRDDLATALGITAEPRFYHEVIWERAIPQYGPGHRALLGEIDARVARLPGFALGGNAYRGLGVGDTVRDALAIARSLR